MKLAELKLKTGELMAAKEKLRHEKAFLQTVIDSLPYPFYVIDTSNHSILLANKTANTMYGKQSIIGQKCYATSHHLDAPCDSTHHPCPIDTVEKTGKAFICEHIHYDKNNHPCIMEVHGYPVAPGQDDRLIMIEYSIDITEKKSLQKEKQTLENNLRQAQKMEAIGTLAGGIAHDFNNILTAILGFSDMACKKISPNDPVHAYLEKIITAGDRAKDLVQQILSFSRQQEMEKQTIQIQPIIKETIKLLRASLPASIKIEQDIAPHCGVINADPTQIHQVLMNLCTNAFHAMEGKPDMVLRISLQEINLNDADIISHPELVPGNYIKLSIADTGCGIDKTIRDKIFEPYFTTKEKGKGTGLGLAVTHGIIKKHHGDISVYSEPGAGTVFNIYLPRIISPAEDKEASSAESLPGGSEHILFVDDEELITQMRTDMLTSLGYQVSAYTSSKQALEAFKVAADQFDLVITDLTMPDMTGKELAENILALRADIPVIICSGFTLPTHLDKTAGVNISAYLAKPTTIEKLATTIRTVLDET